MKKILLLLLVLTITISLSAQEKAKKKIYNPNIDVTEQIESAIFKAKKESKHVLIQIGGNWCSWCILFHDYVEEHDELKAKVDSDYVYILLNIDAKHRHQDIMKRLRFPQRFGYPVFVILDGDGNYLHTQNSALLEKGKSYDLKKVKEFLNNWNVHALAESTYVR